MREAGGGRTYYWERHTEGDGQWRGEERPAGEDLAALRRGLGREPGEAPQMWPFYRSLNEQGRLTWELAAEHLALTLFAVHQQGKERPVHRAGVGLGTAMRDLRHSGKYSPEAIDRRFSAAATATRVTVPLADAAWLPERVAEAASPMDANAPNRRTAFNHRSGMLRIGTSPMTPANAAPVTLPVSRAATVTATNPNAASSSVR